MLEVKVDTHTHTIASVHAYSTLLENITYAKAQGLTGLAVTDHGPAIKETFPKSYFGNLRKSIPEEVAGLRIFKGVEANVIDHEGNLDLPVSTFKKLDIVIASCHELAVKPGSISDHNHLWQEVAKNPWVDIIGHPGNGVYEFDYEKLIKVFKEYDKIVEINASSFPYRKDATKNCETIALLCKKYAVKVAVSSDAHFATSIGDFRASLELLERIEFPQDLIVNQSVASLSRALAKVEE